MSAPEAAGRALSRRVIGIETEYGISYSQPAGSRELAPDDIARYLFRPIVAKYSSSNIFMPNAARLYLDVGAHPEIATGECDSLLQALNHERAGDLIVDELAQKAEQVLREELPSTPGDAPRRRGEGRVYLFKNNIDSVGNSYGCHENYLISRETSLKKLGSRLVPFLVTRQLICGAGCIIPAQGDKGPQWSISQRADHVWEGVSSATTRSRPMINTRDEPHADSSRFRRMHVIVGDSNMAEPSFALKVGSMLLMLEMIEAGFELPEVELRDPISQIRLVSRDLQARTPLECVGEKHTTALALQQGYCAAAKRWLEYRHEDGSGTSNEQMAKVVELWQRTLTALDSGDLSAVEREIDWVIKWNLLKRYQEKFDCPLDDPRLAQIDLTYHDIRPGRGLFLVLEARGAVERWSSDAAIAHARNIAPETTRAHLRGRFLQKAEELHAPVTVDWLRLKLNEPEPRMIELGDPLSADNPQVDELISIMEQNAERWAQP